MEACTIELNRDSNATQKAFSRNWKACASCCSFVVCLAHVQGSWYRSYTLPVSFLSCDALFSIYFPFPHGSSHVQLWLWNNRIKESNSYKTDTRTFGCCSVRRLIRRLKRVNLPLFTLGWSFEILSNLLKLFSRTFSTRWILFKENWMIQRQVKSDFVLFSLLQVEKLR